MFKLRPYQQEAVEAMVNDMQYDGHSLVIVPTAGGKSLILAEAINRINKPTMILQPSREILEQNVAKMRTYVDAHEVGIYSASMNSRQIRKYTFATIGSVYKKPEFFKKFDVFVIDESHLMNIKKSDGMFTRFFESVAAKKVFGLTATPYRNMQAYHKLPNGQMESALTLKLINRVKPDFWRRIIFNINNKELLEQGYLCPLKYYDRSHFDHQQIRMNKSRTDFDTDSFAQQMVTFRPSIVDLIRRAAAKRNSVLVFCNSVSEAHDYARRFPNAAAVDGKTPKDERDRIIKGFREGKIKICFNVNCLSIGFDHPALDTIFMLRPTRSLSLYYQQLGRGIRIAPGKTECIVVDFTSNVKNLGRIETIWLGKIKGFLDKFPMWTLRSETEENWHGKQLYSIELKGKADKKALAMQAMERNL